MTLTISDDDARALLHDDEDELFRKLGADLLGQGVGLADEDPERSRAFGKRWFEAKLPEIRRALCSEEGIGKVRAALKSDGSVDLTVVADLLAGVAGLPPLATLAMIIVRRGVDAICRGAGG